LSNKLKPDQPHCCIRTGLSAAFILKSGGSNDTRYGLFNTCRINLPGQQLPFIIVVRHAKDEQQTDRWQLRFREEKGSAVLQTQKPFALLTRKKGHKKTGPGKPEPVLY
jgi:hypothetical protein